MKKFVGLLLCMVLLLGFAPAGASETAFSDVPAGAWYAEDVNICADAGLMQGTGQGRFSPDAELSIPECVTLAARLHSLTHGGGSVLPQAPETWDFSPPAPGSETAVPGAAPSPDLWFRDAYYYAEVQGLGKTVPHGNSDLTNATRLDFARLMADAAGDLTPINEITSLPDTEDEAVLALYNAGILTGADKFGTFYGDRTLTRAEAAAMLARVLEPERRLSFASASAPYRLTPKGVSLEQYSASNFDFRYVQSSTPTDAYGWLYLQERDTGRAGVMDRDGQWVIAPDAGFSEIAFFCADGLAAARRGEHWGLIGPEGNTVVPFQYSAVSTLHDGFVVCGSWDGEQYGFYDVYGTDGSLLRTLPGTTEDYAALLFDDVAGGLIPFSENGQYDGKMGYLNPDGTVALAAQWYDAKGFSEGLAAVKDRAPAVKSVVDNGSRFGLIDKSGALVIPYGYVSPPFFRDGAAADTVQQDWVDRSGTPREDWAENPLPRDWYAPALDGYSGYRYVNRTFEPVTPPIFDSAAPVKDGSAWVAQENQIYLLTLNAES